MWNRIHIHVTAVVLYVLWCRGGGSIWAGFRPAVVCGNRSPIHNSNHEARSLGEVGVEEIIVAAHPAPAHPGIFQANTLIILGLTKTGHSALKI
uniref:Secreted protein n=1 Tax=Oryza nivara TaxID=4536 RepID=A0A0E0G4B6_ORYNI